MKRIFTALAFLALSVGADAQVTGQRSVPLGYQQLSPVAAASLTVPAGATTALITVSGQPVRFRDDGTAPTTGLGVLLPVTTSGLPFVYTGTLSAFQVIQTTSAATVDVAYYR